MDVAQASHLVLAGVASALGAAYVNAKLALGHDLQQASYQRSFSQRLTQRLAKIEDEATIYRTLELANPDAEALWFEGRTWRYSDVIAGSSLIALQLFRSSGQSIRVEKH